MFEERPLFCEIENNTTEKDKKKQTRKLLFCDLKDEAKGRTREEGKTKVAGKEEEKTRGNKKREQKEGTKRRNKKKKQRRGKKKRRNKDEARKKKNRKNSWIGKKKNGCSVFFGGTNYHNFIFCVGLTGGEE